MNRFEADRRFAQRMKDNYPPGTRIMLLQMGDDPHPIESNTRGTVTVVDDMGTLHCNFDNGRQLGVVSGVDSFRRLTDQEFAEENDSPKKQLTEMSEDKLYERNINIENEEYQQIELLGKPALFTNARLTDADIPQGLYCYHLRHSDDGDRFCSVEPKVGVNYGGSVITKEPIDFGKQGYISFTEDTEPNFIGGEQTLGQFLRSDTPQESEVMKLC